MPMKASAPLGKVDLTTHSLMWFGNRALELANISQRYRDAQPIPRTTWQQWAGIMNKFRVRRGLICNVAAIDEFWQAAVDAVRGLDIGCGSGLLHYLSAQAYLQAEKNKDLCGTEACLILEGICGLAAAQRCRGSAPSHQAGWCSSD